jgi:predicted GIY-YIG superfamily endonuclease
LDDRREVSMSNFHYVYLLIDVSTGTNHYTGCTENLQARLEKHNKGDVPHTAKYRPWKIQTAIAFDTKEKAFAFEVYLKSHSGRAFATKHF